MKRERQIRLGFKLSAAAISDLGITLFTCQIVILEQMNKIMYHEKLESKHYSTRLIIDIKQNYDNNLPIISVRQRQAEAEGLT